MAKRVLLVAIIVAAILVVAAPALAFNGYRGDYTTTVACQTCHDGIAGIPAVYGAWVETKHAEAGADGQATRLPYGSSCGGCHTSNYDPSKVVPTPTATSTSGAVSWGAIIPDPFPAQADGNAPMSENFVGCSSCHYGANVRGSLAGDGVDPNDTAHMAPNANLANAAICGQCHSRYSYTVDTYSVAPVPYVTVTTPIPGTPITPNPSPTSLLQPQYAIGFPMLGRPVTGVWTSIPLSDYLNVPFPGWTPTPNPSATAAAGLMKYWKIDGVDTPWVINGHDGSAVQYVDWSGGADLHNKSLDAVKAVVGPNPPAACLKCHSADYIIAPATAKPTGEQAKYGITCVGCHTPHERGTAEGIWNAEFTPQLRTDSQKTLCVECHNGEIPEGSTASPGAEIHHPMKEMMDGYGAIDVSSFPSVHKGKCVQCHMPPTTLSRGDIQLGANHTFKIIEPGVAAGVTPVPFRTTTPTPGASPVVENTTMPYSACTTCHSRPGDDAAVWLQDTIDQRQDWTHAKVTEISSELDAAAVRLGYANAEAARTALVAMPQSSWTTGQRLFLSGFTNVEFVQSEGSFGLHNWDYTREIVNKALQQARSVTAGVVVKKPWVITFKTSKARVAVNHKVKFSGTVKTSAKVPGAGRVTIQKKVKGHWKAWRTARLNSTGAFAKTVKMTKRGTFYFRAFKPADASNLKKASRSRRLVVK